MEDLTFGEQVKVVLSRKGMTIKELAEIIEEKTGMKMSRQNLTQRLGRDNFQEQDMRMIASILDCPFQLSILGGESAELTPADLRTVEEMRRKEKSTVGAAPKGTASNEMCTFLVVNISSLQLIPINMIAYRSQYGSAHPLAVAGPAFLATCVSTLAGVAVCRVMCRRKQYKSIKKDGWK